MGMWVRGEKKKVCGLEYITVSVGVYLFPLSVRGLLREGVSTGRLARAQEVLSKGGEDAGQYTDWVEPENRGVEAVLMGIVQGR